MNKPRPILYIANAAAIGGGNRVLMDIVSGVDRERFTPVIVTPGPGPLADWAAEQSVEVEIVPDGDWEGRRKMLRRAASLVRLGRARGIGLVHAMAPTCYRAAGLAGQFLRIPRICHLGFPPANGEIEHSFRFGPEVVVPCYEGQARDVMADVRAVRPGCRIVAIAEGIDTR